MLSQLGQQEVGQEVEQQRLKPMHQYGMLALKEAACPTAPQGRSEIFTCIQKKKKKTTRGGMSSLDTIPKGQILISNSWKDTALQV